MAIRPPAVFTWVGFSVLLGLAWPFSTWVHMVNQGLPWTPQLLVEHGELYLSAFTLAITAIASLLKGPTNWEGRRTALLILALLTAFLSLTSFGDLRSGHSLALSGIVLSVVTYFSTVIISGVIEVLL